MHKVGHELGLEHHEVIVDKPDQGNPQQDPSDFKMYCSFGN